MSRRLLSSRAVVDGNLAKGTVRIYRDAEYGCFVVRTEYVVRVAGVLKRREDECEESDLQSARDTAVAQEAWLMSRQGVR